MSGNVVVSSVRFLRPGRIIWGWVSVGDDYKTVLVKKIRGKIPIKNDIPTL